MLKDYKIIKQVVGLIAEAAEEAANAVLTDYSDLQGYEEEVTGQLRGEINRQLLKNVEKRLGNKEINGCKFSVTTFKKRQESKVGADLAGVVDFESGGRKTSKAFLAQAKIGKSYKCPRGETYVRAKNPDILKQAEAMLNITNSSYFFLYSDVGIRCIPAQQVLLAGSNTIDTIHHPSHGFGSFYEEFFKCFIGDQSITPTKLGATSLEEYAEKIKVAAVMRLSVNLGSVGSN